MVHKMWDADQVDWLYYFYINVHNHDTGTDPFRDFDDFFPLVFMNLPSSNYDLGVLTGPRGIEVFGDGTDTLGFRITIPYQNLRHFEDVDQQVPVGLPAPFGFLEPFHFHVEFVVAAVRADSDQDGDVDLDDFAAFLDCLAVSSGSQEPDLRGGATQCMFADTDGNGELDLCDFAGFQRAFTGPHK